MQHVKSIPVVLVGNELLHGSTQDESRRVIHFRIIHFRIFGLSEAYIGSVIESLNLQKELEITYRQQFPEILVSLKSNVLSLDELKSHRDFICSKIGESFIIGTSESDKLPISVFNLLKKNASTISFAESCSGGLLSSEITKIPGASEVFLGSIICYSNQVKSDVLKVPKNILETKGAVSKETSICLAKECKKIIGSDIAVSITGIAGPDGGSIEKPVGLIFISICTQNFEKTLKYQLHWERERNQIYATWLALDLVRRSLKNYKLSWEML